MIPSFSDKLLIGGLLIISLASGASRDALAAPLLRCHVQQGDIVKDVEAAPSADPYGIAALQINHFRFKPVVVGDIHGIDYIKLYTYYEVDSAAGSATPDVRLLHEAKYLSPQIKSGAGSSSLTGTVYLYEPGLQRELIYDCVLREGQS